MARVLCLVAGRRADWPAKPELGVNNKCVSTPIERPSQTKRHDLFNTANRSDYP